MKSHLKERIYLSAPAILQNCLVSAAGAIEHHRRYGGGFRDECERLKSTEFFSAEELNSLRQQQLTRCLANAINNVPYYATLGLRPSATLSDFPVLTRDVIFKNPRSFVSREVEGKKLITLYTGGSTGNPLKVYMTKEVRRKCYAYWKRFYDVIGFKIGDKKASLVGRKLQDPRRNKPPFWRYNAIDRQLLFSSFHVNDATVGVYLNKLNEFRPALIEGYPLSIHRIAQAITENDFKLSFCPKGISTSSENMSQAIREEIEAAFKCKVFDQYGSAESVAFASDCEHNNKHFSVEYGHVEVLGDDGKLNPEGSGELVVTGFVNDAMPLIRYKIGDLGSVSMRACPCGRNSPILEKLHGKVGAVIVTPDGKRVSTASISIAFEYLEHVKKSQITQETPERVRVRLVPTAGFKSKEEDFMLWELRQMLGHDLEILTEYVADIPPAKNGKFQMVVQEAFNIK